MFIDLTQYQDIEGVTVSCPESRININSIDLIRFEVTTTVYKDGKPVPKLSAKKYKGKPGYEIIETNHVTLKKWQPRINYSAEDITITFSETAKSEFEKFKSIVDGKTL